MWVMKMPEGCEICEQVMTHEGVESRGKAAVLRKLASVYELQLALGANQMTVESIQIQSQNVRPVPQYDIYASASPTYPWTPFPLSTFCIGSLPKILPQCASRWTSFAESLDTATRYSKRFSSICWNSSV